MIYGEPETPRFLAAVQRLEQHKRKRKQQNRQALKDRATAETDFKVNLKNEVNIETILRELGEFRAEANTRLESLERRSPKS